MRIAIAAIGSRGDMEPAIALAIALEANGDDVALITPAGSWRPSGSLPVEHVDLDSNIEEMGAVTRPKSRRAWARDFVATRAHVIRQFDQIVDACRNVDLLIASIPFSPAALSVKDRYRTPVCVYSLSPPLVPTRHLPNPWLPRLPVGGLANRLSYKALEQLLWHPIRRQVNRWRRSRDLPPFPLLRYFDRIYDEGIPMLVAASRQLYPVPRDWPSSVHVTGRWKLPHRDRYEPTRDLLEFLGDGPPPVCITFGSSSLEDQAGTLDTLLTALETTGLRGIIVRATGRNMDGTKLCDNVFQVDAIPFSWLFSRVSLVVHHGGLGVSTQTLEAGLPAVVAPIRYDQLMIGQRLADLGVAPKPLRWKSFTHDALVGAIRQAANQRESAEALAITLRGEDGIENALELIYSHAAGVTRPRPGQRLVLAP